MTGTCSSHQHAATTSCRTGPWTLSPSTRCGQQSGLRSHHAVSFLNRSVRLLTRLPYRSKTDSDDGEETTSSNISHAELARPRSARLPSSFGHVAYDRRLRSLFGTGRHTFILSESIGPLPPLCSREPSSLKLQGASLHKCCSSGPLCGLRPLQSSLYVRSKIAHKAREP